LGKSDAPLTEAYCALITNIIKQCGLTKEQTYIVGHSMGGYAAIHFALRLGLRGVFALRPQIDWEFGVQYFSIKKLKDLWIDLDTLLLQTTQVPLTYLQFGEFAPDKGAGLKFLNALIAKNGFVILEKTDNSSHTGYHPTKEYIESTLFYMESIGQ
jgi:pimeloyl-ACP methyl ester carboxylesterase